MVQIHKSKDNVQDDNSIKKDVSKILELRDWEVVTELMNLIKYTL